MGGPGVNRSLQFVKSLRDFGYEPVVLTISENDLSSGEYPLDLTLLDQVPEGIQIVRVPTGEPRKFKKLLVKLRVYRLVWFFFYPWFWEKSALWPRKCRRTAANLIRANNIKIVYTSCGPFSSALIGYHLRQTMNVKWVADLRDPFTDAYAWQFPGKLHWHFARWMEKKIFRSADALILNTPSAADLFEKRGIASVSKLNVITNGY